MAFSLFNIRKCAAGPVAWLMILAMLSPISPHVAEGVALCIGEGHVEVEAAGASHHDGRTTPLAPIGAGKRAQSVSQPHALLDAASQASPAPSGEEECVDVPLRLVKTGDTCYQAVSSGDGEKVPPRLVSQSARFSHASDLALSPLSSDAREPRRPSATVPLAPSSSTVVLLI